MKNNLNFSVLKYSPYIPKLIPLKKKLCIPDTSAQGIITQAFYLGDPGSYNTTYSDCIWKKGNDRDQCPDPQITVKLYTSGEKKRKIYVSPCIKK